MNRREEFAVGDAPSLSVGNRSGSVEVRTAASGQVVVTVDSSDAADWVIDRLGDAITVRPKRSGWRSPSARILVEVPHGTNVDATTASAAVTLTGGLGTTRIKSASGDIRLGSVDRLDIDTTSGDVRTVAVASSASCDTVSGDVWVERVGGRLTVSTASGNVRIVEAADDVEIGSASGDIRVDRFDGDSIGSGHCPVTCSSAFPRASASNPTCPASAGGPVSRRLGRRRCRSPTGRLRRRPRRHQDRVGRHHPPTGRGRMTASS